MDANDAFNMAMDMVVDTLKRVTTPDSATRSADSAESFCDEEMEPHDQNWRHGEEV